MDTDKKPLSGEFVLSKEENPPKTDDSSAARAEEKTDLPKDTTHTAHSETHTPVKFIEPGIPLSNHIHPQYPNHQAHKKSRFYTSLGYYPEGVTVENQENDEEIVLIVRQDFITNLPWIIGAIVLSLLPVIIIPFLPIIAPFFNFPLTFVILFTLFYYLALMGFIIVQFTLWYFQVGIVTTKRIVDVDIHGILVRNVSRALIEDLQDVTYTQVGVIPSLFNYGNVMLQTAGDMANFEFPRAPEPSLIIQILQDLMKEVNESNGI